jgi:FMN phosphatase YigB (HAD superfamily)
MTTENSPEQTFTVTLDLWQTLIAEKDGGQKSPGRRQLRAVAASDAIRSHGLLASPAQVLEAMAQLDPMIVRDEELGMALLYLDRVSQLLSLVDEHLPGDLGEAGVRAVASAIDGTFLERPSSFLPGAHEALERLRLLGVSVGLISNTSLTSAEVYREWFRREGVLDFFAFTVFSNDVGCSKPNPDIFNRVFSAEGALPERSLHIGDNLLADVSGAAGVGMRTGWISGYDKREPVVAPDYTLKDITEAPGVVERWLRASEASGV